MVKVTDYKLRQSQDGRQFYALTLQGGMEIVKSANGNSYATIKKVSIPTTFDEATCKSLIGSELAGFIRKVETEPYEYIVPETAEIITLYHRYEYVDKNIEDFEDFTKGYKHSTNGAGQIVLE